MTAAFNQLTTGTDYTVSGPATVAATKAASKNCHSATLDEATITVSRRDISNNGLAQTPTFTVSVTLAPKGNYTGDAVSKSFAIAKAALTITVDGKALPMPQTLHTTPIR